MDTLILKEKSFVCSHKGGLVTSFYEEVLAIECDKPFVKFRLANRVLSAKVSLSSVEKKLPDCFIRVNRQVVVNVNCVKEIVLKDGGYWMKSGEDLQYKISERRLKAVKMAYTQFP